jgi:hypothetical protein
MCVMASVTLLRDATYAERPRRLAATGYLGLILVLCKSAGAVVFAAIFVPLLVVMGRRWQIMLAALVAMIVVTYPLLRGADLIPVDRIIAAANDISPERGYSLQFRIENENALLARAAEKPWFGWGGYGRNLILDPVTGRALTIADGAWIIALGVYGWLGYITEFGLLALPLVLLGREALLQRSSAFSPFACGMALILAANMMDMLPNATLVPLTWLMAGGLLGYAEALANARKQARKAAWREDLHGGRPTRTVI